MNFLKNLKEKTWIDWVKIVVAIDIASVGIGLVVNMRFHVLAGIFGFFSRIIFGMMYVFVAMLIIKRVFPRVLRADEMESAGGTIDIDIKESVADGKKRLRKFGKKIQEKSDQIIDRVDEKLDKVEDFFEEKKDEVKKEIDHLLHK